MTHAAIIISAAKAAKVAALLLLAICAHESMDFAVNYNPDDAGSPSYGICQVKENTARMLGFKGNAKELMNDKVNAKYAAKYLAYQEKRYGNSDWCVLTAAYNSGTYYDSKKVPGKPKNLKYVRFVQKKLDWALQDRLSCEKKGLAYQ